jgi:hypothetical protein
MHHLKDAGMMENTLDEQLLLIGLAAKAQITLCIYYLKKIIYITKNDQNCKYQ